LRYLIIWAEERLNRKKIEVEIQTWSKLEELIKFKNLIIFLIGLIDLFKDLIEKMLSVKVNLKTIRRIN
jgi:hypothetical protein